MAGICRPSGEKAMLLDEEPELGSAPAAGCVLPPQAARSMWLPAATAASAVFRFGVVRDVMVTPGARWRTGLAACVVRHRKPPGPPLGNPDRSDASHRRPLFPPGSRGDLA